MRLGMLAIAGTLVLGISSGPLALATENADAAEHRAHEVSANVALELDQGEKWQTDAPLRQGMEGVREALQGRLQAIHDNDLPTSEYRALADQVDAQVTYMFENCELPPQADAQLHTLLAHILSGTRQMRSDADSRAGAVQVVRALDAYPRYFAHPGWSPMGH